MARAMSVFRSGDPRVDGLLSGLAWAGGRIFVSFPDAGADYGSGYRSGTSYATAIASAVIALFAAGLLTRDGGLVALSLILLLAVPVAVWQFGFSG